MGKIKELLFWRFSLPVGVLALVSIFVLSYFYYSIQVDTPFTYWQVISHLSEYRVLDSRIPMFDTEGNLNEAPLRDNLLMQRNLLETISQTIYTLKEKEIAVPQEAGLLEIEKSILYRNKWIKSCSENDACDIADWMTVRYKAWEACEKLLSDFNLLVAEREHSWSKKLSFFYILSVMLLLSTLFFAAGKKSLSSR
ncbi:MAG: hypothetical protein LBH25_07550 [Fibromonadaceae bacterium]|jgi:hypothetical protein|nr:hypothetical protein [Fibromonadaceae bacterium]